MTAQPSTEPVAGLGAGMPDDVLAALAVLCDLGVDGFASPEHAATVQAQLAERSCDDSASRWMGRELQLVQACERVTAWVGSRQLGALRRMREAAAEICASVADQPGFREADASTVRAIAGEPDALVVDEVVAATGLPEAEIYRRTRLACGTTRRMGVLWDALATGRTTLARACRVAQVSAALDHESAAVVASRVLAPPRGCEVRSHPSFVRELRRQVLLHCPDQATRRADALRQRAAWASVDDEIAGTGRLTLTGDLTRVVAAFERVDGLARGFRAAGDPRTLEQLRSDILLDLVMRGWPSHPHTAPVTVDGEHPQVRDPLGTLDAVGEAPPASVQLVVAMSTLLGLDDATAELPGWGTVTAEHARQAAFAAGSVWRRLVVDPVTGAATELSTQRYRPTAAMAAQVAAFDGTCRAPGCQAPPSRCDLDHLLPWPRGQTAVPNLQLLHRRHHNHKTFGTWTAVNASDHDAAPRTVDWTTAAGRRYHTLPHNYLDPAAHPAGDAEYDAASNLTENSSPPY